MRTLLINDFHERGISIGTAFGKIDTCTSIRAGRTASFWQLECIHLYSKCTTSQIPSTIPVSISVHPLLSELPRRVIHNPNILNDSL